MYFPNYPKNCLASFFYPPAQAFNRTRFQVVSINHNPINMDGLVMDQNEILTSCWHSDFQSSKTIKAIFPTKKEAMEFVANHHKDPCRIIPITVTIFLPTKQLSFFLHPEDKQIKPKRQQLHAERMLRQAKLGSMRKSGRIFCKI